MIDVKDMHALAIEIFTKNGSIFSKIVTFDSKKDASRKAFDFRLSIMRVEGTDFASQEFFTLDESIIRKSEIESCRMEISKVQVL